MKVALIAHGGAGNIRPGGENRAVEGMDAAVHVGRAILLAGGSALDAVCATVVALEDNPAYNAGTGSCLNYDGFVEMDACVMESANARAGAVAALQRVKNPILVARKVMEETDHVMLAGEGAQRFARTMGFADHDPVTGQRREDWADKKRRIAEVLGPKSLNVRRFLKEHPAYSGGTVGAAAVDGSGLLAAATSTGGVTLKLVGRIGDTPIPGAGNYASEHVAASATGTGEYVMRLLSTRAVSERVADGEGLDAAVRAVLGEMGRMFDADVGIIAVDRHGNAVAQHRTRDMPHAWFSGDSAIIARARA
jgi:beta-aspartyl-peptidase (threonine type)